MNSQTVHLATPCLLLLHEILNIHFLFYFIKFRLTVTLLATKCTLYKEYITEVVNEIWNIVGGGGFVPQ
jgi:hypothetical protein